MEMHHKLRRDPSWHPSGCNICGGVGHQAAQCTNGTINWRRLYGDESFRLKDPLYESQLLQIHKDREIDLAALEARARQYSEMKSSTAAINMSGVGQQVQGMALDAGGSAVSKPPPAKADLPPGWALAKDDAGRVYYWHVKTKKVTWDVPTASTSIEP